MGQSPIPNNKVFTKENAAEMGRRGGIASQKKARERKTFRETLEILLNMPMEKGKKIEPEDVQSMAKLLAKKKNGKPVNIDNQTAIAISMLRKAQDGDVRAAEGIRDMTGEKPKTDIDVKGQLPVTIVNDLKDEDNEGKS